MLQDFAAVTEAVDAAINANDLVALQQAIRMNHALLQNLGVVPDRVSNLISDLEQNNFAAKICGAGAIRGDSAGIVMVVADEDPTPIVQKHGFSVETVQVDQNGTTIL